VKLTIYLAFCYLLNISLDNTALTLDPYYTLSIIPVLVYYEPKLDKASILTENKGKSGFSTTGLNPFYVTGFTYFFFTYINILKKS